MSAQYLKPDIASWVFLIPAYAAIPSVLCTITSECRKQYAYIRIFTPVTGIAEFLRPLEELGIRVQLLSYEPVIRPLRPWTLPQERAKLHRELSVLFDAIPPSKFYFYGTSFSKFGIASIAYADKLGSHELLLEDWDHTGAVGLREDPAKGMIPALYGLASQWVLRAPLRMIRKESPIPILKQNFVSQRMQILPKQDITDPQNRIDGEIYKRIFKTVEADILWLYDMYDEHFGEEKVPGREYQAFWETLIDAVKTVRPGLRHAFKIHPRANNIPRCFDEMEFIDRSTPVEFLNAPNLRYVVGLSSFGLNHFAKNENISVISPLQFCKLEQEIYQIVITTLNQWVDPCGKILRPECLRSFQSAFNKKNNHE